MTEEANFNDASNKRVRLPKSVAILKGLQILFSIGGAYCLNQCISRDSTLAESKLVTQSL
jgi:hypothetical protein